MEARILVADDDPMISASLKRVLSYEKFEVFLAGDGTKAIELFSACQPDLVILDVVMPGLSGIEVCRAIRRMSPVPVLFLSARDEVSDRVEGLNGGGDDYLIKPFAYEELLARIRVLLRRSRETRPQVLQFSDLTLDVESHTASRGKRKFELSSTEYQLLVYLMSNPRRVLTKDMILEAVWGYDFGGESNVVEVYVSYLRTKLELGGECRLIHTVRGSGYILKEQEQS